MEKLKTNFNETGQVQAFISERKQLTKDALAKYTHLPRGLQKQYDRINKTAYYYKAQVQEYKNILEDPKKIEAATIQVLNKLPEFQKFMQQNSQLASLFRLPGNAGSTQNLSGLQTRASVQSMIQNRIASAGPNAMNQNGSDQNSSFRISGNGIVGGNVLIGKTTQANPNYKLDVNGNIRSNKIVVNTTGADFIFDPGYQLPNLDSLSTYIQKYRHLPAIPSATEMQRDGLNVGDNQIRLLQKIEELTLFIIEQYERIEKLEKELN